MADELKPCPFCRASGENLGLLCDPAEGSDNSGPSRRVQCYGCNIEAPFYDSADEAIAAWNARPAPKADSALVRELRDSPEYTLVLNVDTGEKGDSHVRISSDLRDRILAALSDRDVALEEAVKVADHWADYYVNSKLDAEGIARAIRSLKGGVDE